MFKFSLVALFVLISLGATAQEESSIVIPDEVQDSIKRLKRLEGEYWQNGDELANMFVRHELLTKYSIYFTEKEKATWCTKVAESYFHLGSHLLAIEFLNKSLEYDNPELKEYTQARIGASYIQLDELDSAVVHYKEAIKSSVNDSRRMPHMNSLGFVYYLGEDYSSALEWYENALDLFKEAGNIDSVQYYIVLSNLASLSEKTGMPTEGLRLLKKIELWSQFEKVGDWFVKEVSMKIAELHLAEKQCEKASCYIAILEKLYGKDELSAEYLKFLEVKIEYAQLCGSKAELDGLMSDYIRMGKEVRVQDRERLLIVEKLQRSAFENQLTLVSTNLELKEGSEQILELSNSRLIRLFWIGGVLFMCLLAFVIFWFIQKRAKQQRMESFLLLKEELLSEQEKTSGLQIKMAKQEMENKKLEMSQILNSINRNSALIEELQKRLTALRDKEGDMRDDISQLLHFLKSHGSSSEISELIEENFDVLGGNFKEKIEGLFPDLTASELQLMILMKIGLSTKEMALMKNVEPSSIRIFKHRLKAKIGLKKEEDLMSFVSSI